MGSIIFALPYLSLHPICRRLAPLWLRGDPWLAGIFVPVAIEPPLFQSMRVAPGRIDQNPLLVVCFGRVEGGHWIDGTAERFRGILAAEL